jgi:hypothetical protein
MNQLPARRERMPGVSGAAFTVACAALFASLATGCASTPSTIVPTVTPATISSER